jgi:hypothetical protein
LSVVAPADISFIASGAFPGQCYMTGTERERAAELIARDRGRESGSSEGLEELEGQVARDEVRTKVTR